MQDLNIKDEKFGRWYGKQIVDATMNDTMFRMNILTTREMLYYNHSHWYNKFLIPN